MQKQKTSTTPNILGLSNVVLNSFHRRVSNTSEEFSRTPEVSFPEIFPQPRMLVQKFKGAVAFKQLKRFANAHSRGNLDEEMHMVNSNMQFINAEAMAFSSFPQEAFTVAHNAIELKRVHGVFRLPHKVESVLPEGMVERLQIHFFPPESARGKKAHANSNVFCRGLTSSPLYSQEFHNFKLEDGAPPMLESRGIRAAAM